MENISLYLCRIIMQTKKINGFEYLFYLLLASNSLFGDTSSNTFGQVNKESFLLFIISIVCKNRLEYKNWQIKVWRDFEDFSKENFKITEFSPFMQFFVVLLGNFKNFERKKIRFRFLCFALPLSFHYSYRLKLPFKS